MTIHNKSPVVCGRVGPAPFFFSRFQVKNELSLTLSLTREHHVAQLLSGVSGGTRPAVRVVHARQPALLRRPHRGLAPAVTLLPSRDWVAAGREGKSNRRVVLRRGGAWCEEMLGDKGVNR